MCLQSAYIKKAAAAKVAGVANTEAACPKKLFGVGRLFCDALPKTGPLTIGIYGLAADVAGAPDKEIGDDAPVVDASVEKRLIYFLLRRKTISPAPRNNIVVLSRPPCTFTGMPEYPACLEF